MLTFCLSLLKVALYTCGFGRSIHVGIGYNHWCCFYMFSVMLRNKSICQLQKLYLYWHCNILSIVSYHIGLKVKFSLNSNTIINEFISSVEKTTDFPKIIRITYRLAVIVYKEKKQLVAVNVTVYFNLTHNNITVSIQIK